MGVKQTEALKLALEALEYISSHYMSLPKIGCMALAAVEEELAEQPEFITHSVEQPYDWSEWVCPDPKSYLMKCCDCGLVHEAQFGVVRYKSEIEREDCDMVDDPNLQAVFRMRRSEQWSPSDTAHRAGGLPMEQPAQQQEPVAWVFQHEETGRTMCVDAQQVEWGFEKGNPRLKKIAPLYKSPPASKPLTDEQAETAFKAWHYKHGNNTQGIKWVDDLLRSCWKAAIEAAHAKGDV